MSACVLPHYTSTSTSRSSHICGETYREGPDCRYAQNVPSIMTSVVSAIRVVMEVGIVLEDIHVYMCTMYTCTYAVG